MFLIYYDMRIPRIYQPIELAPGILAKLNIETCHYLTRVLRLKNYAPIIIFNGKGGEYQAKLIIKSSECFVEVFDYIAREAESPLKIHLGQGIAKGDKMDFIIQKAVELGITECSPLITNYCNMHLNSEQAEKKQQRWQLIAIHACEQSGRNRIPAVHKPLSLPDWLNKLPSADLRIFLHPTATNAIHALVNSPPQSIQIIIGSEGGFSTKEEELIADYKFFPIRLGPRVLRTETASLTTISLLQGLWGDFSY